MRDMVFSRTEKSNYLICTSVFSRV